jgi:signal transduction histidine kinase
VRPDLASAAGRSGEQPGICRKTDPGNPLLPYCDAVRVPERAWRTVDVVVAVALAVLVCASIAGDEKLGPTPVLLVLALVQTLPLALRHRYPAFVSVTSVTAYAALNAVATGPYPPDIAVLPAVWAVFSGAALTAGRTAVIVGLATFVGVEVAWVVTPDGDPNDFLPWLLWGGPFGAGRLMRRRDVTVSALEAKTQLLELRRAAAEAGAARRERDRIARELHDVVAHAVSVIVVQAGAERLSLAASGPDTDRTSCALSRIEQAGRDALAELRTMLGVLRDPADTQLHKTAPQPGLDNVPRLVEQLAGQGLPIELRVVGEPQPVSSAVGLSAYRIVQEGLTNAVNHGGPGRIEVRLEYRAGRLLIEVDNACLDSPRESAGSGLGLIGARERALSVTGDFAAGPHEGRWLLRASMPYQPAAVGSRR